MTARRSLAFALVAALGAGAGLAGCKDKESLVVVTLTTAAGDTSLATATISVGTHSESFDLKPAGVPASGVSFGVYVPASVTGRQTISVVASPAEAGNCNGETGTGDVSIGSVGGTYGPVLIVLSPSTAACPGTGGTTGTGGSKPTGGTSGAGGTAGRGAAGSSGTGGHGGATGTGGTGGHGGATGTGGTGGHGGATGTGGTGATGGRGVTPTGITACFEYDHSFTGNCATSACTNDYPVYGAAFSPVNAGLAVTGATDGRTKVWTVSNGALVAEGHILTGSGNGVLAFSPDGSMLAVGQSGSINVFSVSTWTVSHALAVTSTSKVFGVDFSPDGTQVISIDNDSSTQTGHLYVHSLANAVALHSVAITNPWALAVSHVSSGGGVPVAVTTTTGNVLLFSLTPTGFAGPTVVNVTSDGSMAETATFSPDASIMAAGGDDGFLRFWPPPFTGAAQGPNIGISTIAASTLIDVVAFSPDGSELAVGAGFFGSVTTFSTATRMQVGVEQDTSMVYDVTALGYSPDGRLIIGGEDSCGCVFLCQH
ncbi:MAG: WD40 repeat domain-containing protein [Pseudomonadota bacterium]